MANSPNYAWSEPDNTSLVKDGAQAIRTLGDAIDTSVWNIGFGQAGKNKIINGDMGIWQRGTSITLPNNTPTYAQDRFYYYSTHSAGTATVTQQTFTPGTAPVAGYEGQYFARMTCGSTTTYGEFGQKIEDVRKFANNTITFSYWAKASVTTTLSQNIGQNFGSGGSGAVYTNPGPVTVTTSWQRFSTTVAMPSIAGKTIGAGNHVIAVFTFTPTASQTLDIWGVQLEYGSKATPFQTASGGSPQAELAMCQRYLPSWTNNGGGTTALAIGQAYSTTQAAIVLPNPVTARVAATGITLIGSTYSLYNSIAAQQTGSALIINGSTNSSTQIVVTVGASLVAGNATNFLIGSGVTILATGCEL